jgi:hypothetical protein
MYENLSDEFVFDSCRSYLTTISHKVRMKLHDFFSNNIVWHANKISIVEKDTDPIKMHRFNLKHFD